MATLSGPMFMPSSDPYRRSSFDKQGAHYNIYATHTPDTALQMLREWFPDGAGINYMNFVLFSTSGVHGMYTTIEEVEQDIKEYGDNPPDDDDEYHPREVTFLLVQPRIVGLTYGNCACRTLDDVKFLKRIRELSWLATQQIGANKEPWEDLNEMKNTKTKRSKRKARKP